MLRKYYDHPEKYSVEDGYLRCGGWGLRMDNDLPNHVVVFLGDLGHLAYEEQLYWKSFNIPPQADRTSDAHYRRAFLAEFADPSSPDLVLKQKLVAIQEGWEQRFKWQLFRPLQNEDAHVIKQLRIPLTESMGEFEQQTLLLAKLIIDSLNDAKLAEGLGSALPDEKSLGKFERFLKVKGYPFADRDASLLRLLQSVRSTAAAHRKGAKFNTIRNELQLSEREVSDVFRELIGRVNGMFSDFRNALPVIGQIASAWRAIHVPRSDWRPILALWRAVLGGFGERVARQTCLLSYAGRLKPDSIVATEIRNMARGRRTRWQGLFNSTLRLL